MPSSVKRPDYAFRHGCPSGALEGKENREGCWLSLGPLPCPMQVGLYCLGPDVQSSAKVIQKAIDWLSRRWASVRASSASGWFMDSDDGNGKTAPPLGLVSMSTIASGGIHTAGDASQRECNSGQTPSTEARFAAEHGEVFKGMNIGGLHDIFIFCEGRAVVAFCKEIVMVLINA